MVDMKIDQYHLTSDRYEVRVSKMTLDENGQPVVNYDQKTGTSKVAEVTLGHCNDVAGALKFLRGYLLRTGNERITTVDQLARESQKIERQFDVYIKERVPEGL